MTNHNSTDGVQASGVPFEEWLDGWLRAHPDVPTYDKDAMRDAFAAGRACGVALPDGGQR